MLLRRRQRIEQVQVEKPKPEPVAAEPVRRLRLTSNNTAAHRERAHKAATPQLDAYLKLISRAEADIDKAQQVIDDACKKIESLMKDALIDEHSYGQHIAKIVEQWTNQGRTIYPKKFRAKVTADVFWDSIDVSVTKAKNHLTEAEINAISDVVPAKFLGRVLKIKRKEIKARK